jgi:hypothetical protein
MAVATSVWWDLVTALLAAVRADATLGAAPCRIMDGPILLDASSPVTLIIGGTALGDDGEPPSGTIDQRWGEVGARARYEDTSVVCELVVRDGSVDLSGRRATAQTYLAALETLLRTGFTLGVGRLMWAEISSAQIRQRQVNTGGSAVSVIFTITARARLASQ